MKLLNLLTLKLGHLKTLRLALLSALEHKTLPSNYPQIARGIYCDGFGVSYATTSQNTRYIRCNRCYSAATQQFLTVKSFLCETEATENATVREGVFDSRRRHCI
jgi:hypothetical protein